MGAPRAAARACVLLVLTVMASVVTVVPAHAAPVALSGTVASPGGAGLPQVDVTVYSSSGTVVRETVTDSTGAWTAQVEPGSYKIGFDDPQGWYVPEFWDDRTTLAAASALAVPTTGRTGVAVQLARRPVVSGTVRSGGTPVADAEVRAYASAAETDAVRTVTTAADGTYAMPLAAGTYRFAFESADHVIEYWNDRATLAGSDAVTVGTADLSARDVTLAPLPVVSGRVTAGGAAVRRPEVTVFSRDATDSWVEQETVTGDAQGRYRVRLDPGRYTFRFAGDERHRPEYWADRPALSTASAVDLISTPRTLDADLAVHPTVRGKVVDAGGEGVEDADVVLLDAAGDELASGRTGPDGGFAVPVLTGAHGLQVRAAGFRAWARAGDDPVLVGPRGVDVGTIDLVAAQAIRGRVTGPGGAPVRTDVVVHVATASNGRTWWSRWDRVRTAADGTYAAPVPPGDYRLEVEGTDDLVGEFWEDASGIDGARTVTVGESDVTGRDAVLAARVRSGVQGTVTASGGTGQSGAGLAGARVSVHALRSGVWSVVARTTTQRDGSYRLYLPAGSYRLGVEADGHRTSFGAGETTVEAASSFTIGSGVATRDVRLVPVSARIQGTVRGPAGGLADVEVVVLQGATETLAPIASARTDATGAYDVRVDAGRYVLAFSDPTGDHRGEYFDDATTWATASRVVVADGATVVGRDVRLDAHPRLAGRVVTTTGAGVGDATVRLVRPFDEGGDVVAETVTDARGSYDVAAPVGTYALEVLVDDEPRWTASSLTLASGTTSRTITLADQRTVSGRLTGPDGRPAVGVEVRAWRYDPRGDDAVVVARTVSGADGRYVLAVPPGVLRLGFHGLEAGYATEFAGDVTDVAEAREIRVAGSDVTGVDGVLGAATGVTGTISDVAAVVGEDRPELETIFYRSDPTTGRWVEQERTTPGYGTYTAELPPGRYRVRVVERQEPYRTSHHGGGTFSSAADVEVVAGGLTPGVDVVIGAALGTLRSTAAPSLPERVAVGESVTADPGTWSPADATSSYQWLRDGQPIAGATARTYVPGAADAERSLAVRVVGSRAGFRSGVAVSAARTVAPGTLRAASAPQLSVDPVIGTPVTAPSVAWSVAGVTVGWTWLRDGSPIPGATGERYVPTSDDVGRALAVRLTGSAAGYTPLGLTTPARTVSDPPLASDGAPTVGGTAVIGSTVTAADGTWNRTPSTVTREWLRDGLPIAGATGTTLRLGAADVDATVAVRVTATVAGQSSVVVTSTGRTVAAGTLTATQPPSVSGTSRPGSTLTGRPGTWTSTDPTGDPVAFGYQWVRGDVPIAGATAATYRPVAADVGHVLGLRVTARKAGHTSGNAVATSAPVKVAPTVSVSAKSGKRKATFTVVVKATGTSPTGSVRIRLGSKTLKTVSLSTYRGTRRAVLPVSGLARGTKTYTVEYVGDANVEARAVTKKVKVT